MITIGSDSDHDPSQLLDRFRGLCLRVEVAQQKIAGVGTVHFAERILQEYGDHRFCDFAIAGRLLQFEGRELGTSDLAEGADGFVVHHLDVPSGRTATEQTNSSP